MRKRYASSSRYSVYFLYWYKSSNTDVLLSSCGSPSKVPPHLLSHTGLPAGNAEREGGGEDEKETETERHSIKI
jgi:hypothetical protein